MKRLHGVYFTLQGVGRRQHVFKTDSLKDAKKTLSKVYPRKQIIIEKLAPVRGKQNV